MNNNVVGIIRPNTVSQAELHYGLPDPLTYFRFARIKDLI